MITIPLKPMPAPRPRFSKNGTYNPSSYTKYKNDVLTLAKQQCKTYFNGALSLDITFYMEIPESLSKIKREALMGEYHISKPDSDNLLKSIKDALEGTFYKNDSQICKVNMEKVYSNNPRTEFVLSEIVLKVKENVNQGVLF